MMPSERWTYLTTLQGGSSGGPSVLAYEVPSGQNLLTHSAGIQFTEPAWFQGTVGSPTESFSFVISGDGENIVKRILSCIIISMMPLEGVDEAYTSLRSMLGFYLEPVAPQALPEVQRGGSGRVASVTRRPDLSIVE